MEQCETCRHPVSLTCTYCRECSDSTKDRHDQLRTGRGSDGSPPEGDRRGRGSRRFYGRRGAEGPACP